MSSCITELLSQGNPVKIDGLGTFVPTVESTKEGITRAALLEGKWNASTYVKAIHIRFRPEGTGDDDITSRRFKEQCALSTYGKFAQLVVISSQLHEAILLAQVGVVLIPRNQAICALEGKLIAGARGAGNDCRQSRDGLLPEVDRCSDVSLRIEDISLVGFKVCTIVQSLHLHHVGRSLLQSVELVEGAEGVLLGSRHGERQAERHFRTFRKRAVECRLSSHACCQREVGGRVSIKFDGRRSRIARLCIGQTAVVRLPCRYRQRTVGSGHQIVADCCVAVGTETPGYGCLFSWQFFCDIPDGLVIHASNS